MSKEKKQNNTRSEEMAVCKIDFEPVGRRGECRDDESLLTCARKLGIGINSICGGQGTCHACKVQIINGNVSGLSPNEQEAFSAGEIKDGWRLACQTYPISNCKLNIPPESMTTPQRTQIEGLETTIRAQPASIAYDLQLQSPSLDDLQADASRLLETLNKQYQLNCDRIDTDTLRGISPRLRSWSWQCQATVRDREVIAISPRHSPQLGLAIDLGTTKIAGYLVNLDNGQTLAAEGVMNPQISYGEDIISRITAAIKLPDVGLQLRKMVSETLNGLAVSLCAKGSNSTEDIVEAVVVGNTAMHHLFIGLPIRQLALSPFVPAVSRSLDIKARDLNLHLAPGAYVHFLPNIAGFVGADHVAMLLATGALQAKEPLIVLDIGTNTEVSFVNNGNITAVSCASGPAFEGGHIRDGMRAASGAIERLRITDNNIEYQTIDNEPPVGICGSGILDAMAQLYLAGIIDKDGRMKGNRPRLRTHNTQREYVLVSKKERGGKSPIAVTQGDIRELQMGKAAIRTGIQVLLEANQQTDKDIKKIIIAGAFGSYINVASAIETGMLPALPLDCFRQVGNAAGMGAKLALISREKRDEAKTIASKVNYIELASAPNFSKTFMQASYLGRYTLINGSREVIE